LPVPFARGELFFALADGTVLRETPTGSLIQIMNTGTGSFTYGMAFDSAQNLYVSDFGAHNVSKFDNTGVSKGFFGSGYGGSVEDVVFNSAGDLIAGSVDGDNTIRIFSPTGAPVAQYPAAPQDRGIDWFDLASDQCTLYYTSEGTSIKRFDICKGLQLADFVTNLPGVSAYALRILPSGGFLVADTLTVERLDANGNIIQSYSTPGATEFYALDLDPDGTSFWTGDYSTLDAYKFDISTGKLLLTLPVTSISGGFGIAVNGEITTSTDADLSLTMTASPSSVSLNNNLTYTLTATNNGPNSAPNVTVTDTLPAGLTYVSATASTGSCSGTVTVICNLGNLANTVSATVTIVVTVTASGSVTNSANVTSDAPDPNPANNTASTSTAVGGTSQLTLSAATLSLPGTHINQTCTPGTVTVTNSGATAVTISNVGISGPFVVSANTCPLAPATLAAGASCAVTVTFVPTTVGAQTGTLVVASNAANNPNATVALSGNGLPACFLTPNTPATTVLRGSDSTTFTVAHQACSAAGAVHLSCSNQSPATCAFSPEILTSPDMSSTLTVSNLQALTSDLKFQVHADAALEHLYTGLSVDLMDFLMASAAASGSVNAGEAASYALAVAPAHGLQGTVSFTCSGAPTGATCTVSPQSVTLNGTGSSTVSVQVATTARSMLAPPATRRMLPPGMNPLGLLALGLMALLASLLVWTNPSADGLAPARLRLATLAAGLMVAMVLTWAACGGTAVSPVSSNPMGTPAGTYTLTVTGTYTATGSSTEIVHTTALTLTVH